MEDRILIWITNAFFNLGLARSLQKKSQFKLFAISNADGNGSDYLKNQSIVNFEKIWVCPDKLEESDGEPDMDYLEEFERKYQISLWKIIYGDRRLIKENQRYYKFSRKEHLLIAEQVCKLFEKILQESKPNYLVLPQSIGYNDHLLYLMCKALKIKVIMLRTSRVGFRLALSENVEEFDEIDIQGKQFSKEISIEDIQKFFGKFSAIKQVENMEPDFKVSKIEKIKAFLEFLMTGNSSNEHFVNYGKTRVSLLKKGSGIKHRIRKNVLKKFMNENVLKEMKNEKFVYFPFHKEPERMLDIGAPYFADQKSVAKMIAKSLPIDFKLYVKDHPAQLKITTGWKRSKKYYQELLELPNVEIIHPSVKSKDIIEKCSCVFTINGTTTLETAIYNKPSFILTDTDFVKLPSIIKLDKLQDFSSELKQALKTKVDIPSLSEYIDELDKNSFKIDVNDLKQDFFRTFPYPGFLKWPEFPPKKVEKYLDKHEEVFDMLADKHINKIKKFKQLEIT